MSEDKITPAQYLGIIILAFCMAFGMYAAGYKHGQESLWGDVWRKTEEKVIYKYRDHDPCDEAPWKEK